MASRNYAVLHVNAELAGFVKAWRMRLERDTSSTSPGRRRRRGNVTQEELAEIVGVSVVWYSNLERGVRANYSDAFLDAVADALRLGREERELLHLLAVGRTPPPLPAAGPVVAGHGLHQFVRGQRWPTYVLDRYARVIVHNAACEAYYPWLRDDRSYPRWLFTSADARRRLVNWETDWAAPLLAQIRVARARRPHDRELDALADACRESSAEARRLWDAYAGHARPARSRRGIRRCGDGRTTFVDVVALADLEEGELQVVSLLPADPN